MNIFINSEIDTKRFLFPTYFLNEEYSLDELKNNFTDELFKIHNEKLLIIAKIKDNKSASIVYDKMNFLSSVGFKFMGTKILLQSDKREDVIEEQKNKLFKMVKENPILNSFKHELCTIDDIEKDMPFIEDLLGQSFNDDFHGHYHANKLLDKNKCRDIYVDWGLRLLRDNKTSKNFKITEISSDKIIGFSSGKLTDSYFEGDLILIDKQYKSKNLAKHNVLSFLQSDLYLKSDNIKYMTAVTQLTNLHSLALFTGCGFKIVSHEQIFHYTKI